MLTRVDRGTPVFSIHRAIFPSSQLILENSSGDLIIVACTMNNGGHLELGALISTRNVGPFVVRLVHEARDDAWNLVEARTPQEGVVVLTYSSREIAARYVEEAAEIDLISDFDPASHFFGELHATRHS
jgi:hypothetical protein